MTSDDALKIKLAEYEALRYEITTFLGLQGQFMSYSIALSSGILALGSGIVALGAKDPDTLKVPAVILAFLPAPFLILGILYGDVKMRILRVALYIEKELRPALIDGSPELMSCLRWESFIREPGDMIWFLLPIADLLRYLVFLLPVVALWVLWWWNRSYTKHPCLCMLLVVFEAIVFFGLAFVMWKLESYDRTLHKKTV